MPRPRKYLGLHDRTTAYHQSDKGKAAIQKYEATDAAKERKRKWWRENKAKNSIDRTQQFLDTYGDPEAALVLLNDTERQVVRCYFGLNQQPPQTLVAIAAQLDLSKQRISRIKAKALEKLTPIEPSERSSHDTPDSSSPNTDATSTP